MVGGTAALVMYASQYADALVCGLIFGAPTALVLALALQSPTDPLVAQMSRDGSTVADGAPRYSRRPNGRHSSRDDDRRPKHRHRTRTAKASQGFRLARREPHFSGHSQVVGTFPHVKASEMTTGWELFGRACR